MREDETWLRGWMLSKPTKGAERAGEDARCWERFAAGVCVDYIFIFEFILNELKNILRVVSEDPTHNTNYYFGFLLII
jgi:hypothetical protein